MTLLCDSHIHVVADIAAHPMVEGRPYTPGPAAMETLIELGAREGIARFVVVQPSFYGDDNDVLKTALRVLGKNGRAVAVVDPETVGDDELTDFHELGVRGLRLNLYSPGKGSLAASLGDRFHATADLARRMNWHVECLANLPELLEAADLLAESHVPIVIDHYGLPGRLTPNSPEGRRLIDLARHDHVWTKLSAPYRSGDDPLAVVPNAAWLAAFLDAAGDRCVWGSDWPHTPPHEAQPGGAARVPYRPMAYPTVVAGFRNALPSPAWAERIMGSNPGRLYGFDP